MTVRPMTNAERSARSLSLTTCFKRTHGLALEVFKCRYCSARVALERPISPEWRERLEEHALAHNAERVN